MVGWHGYIDEVGSVKFDGARNIVVAETVTGEVGARKVLRSPALLWLVSHGYWHVAVHNMVYGDIITVVGWHGYGRGRGP